MGRRSYFFHPWMLVGLPLLFAATASASILLLNQHADTCRQIQIDMSRIRGIAYQIHACEEQAVSEKAVTAQTAQEDQQADKAMQDALHTLLRSQPQNAQLLSIETAFKEYDAALETEFASIRQGKLSQGEEIAEARVDPAFETLQQNIAAANTCYEHQARMENLLVDVGTTVILFLCAGALSIFLIRFEQARHSKAKQLALEHSEAHIRSLISNVSDIIVVLDTDSTVRFVSAAVERLLGCPVDSLLGKPLLPLVHANDYSNAENLLAAATQGQTETTGGLRLRTAEGDWLSFEVAVTNLLSDACVQGLLVTFRDITERKDFETRIAHQAFHDALTGLPNRALFTDRLQSALTRSRRHGKPVGVLFIDLDNFKIINDSLGHEAGDSLLKVITERLQACVRPGDTVARLGGDEFTLLLEDLTVKEDAVQVAERIVQQLKSPISLAGQEIFGSASIGIAVTPEGADDADGLMRDADTAMYQAKTSGKASYILFDRSMNDRVVERLELENGLRRALEQNEFCVLYQPIISIATGEVTGAEALIRWEHPKLGLISPAKFIPVAEDTGLIIPIGGWVLREACRQAKVWLDAQGAQTPFVMSVNLSGRQLQSPELVTMVADVLAETGLPPCCLKLEVTESVMMADIAISVGILKELKALGVLLAIDDFGTGYSSLSYLQQLPVDTVKIDRSFISMIGAEVEPAAIVQTIITLCRMLNLNVTGEGIENMEQLAQLQKLGCDLGQGYHFSKPVGSEAFNSLLGSRQADAKKNVQNDSAPQTLPRAA